MAKQPKPGMGQDEKDKLGAALHEQTQREAELEAAAATTGTWRPDTELGDMTADQLREEAARRGVNLPQRLSTEEAARRLVERRKDVDRFVRQRQQAAATPPTGQ